MSGALISPDTTTVSPEVHHPGVFQGRGRRCPMGIPHHNRGQNNLKSVELASRRTPLTVRVRPRREVWQPPCSENSSLSSDSPLLQATGQAPRSNGLCRRRMNEHLRSSLLPHSTHTAGCTPTAFHCRAATATSTNTPCPSQLRCPVRSEKALTILPKLSHAAAAAAAPAVLRRSPLVCDSAPGSFFPFGFFALGPRSPRLPLTR